VIDSDALHEQAEIAALLWNLREPIDEGEVQGERPGEEPLVLHSGRSWGA
jgi:hypothetical protein